MRWFQLSRTRYRGPRHCHSRASSSAFPHLSSPEVPSLRQRYPASPVVRTSPPPCPGPACPWRDSGLARARHRQGFPCCCSLPLPCVPAPIPRRVTTGTSCRSLPRRCQPSPIQRRVGLRSMLFEACSAFTRVLARRVAEPPNARPFDASVLQSISLPPRTALAATNRSDSCCAGFAPARRKRLSTAHKEHRH